CRDRLIAAGRSGDPARSSRSSPHRDFGTRPSISPTSRTFWPLPAAMRSTTVRGMTAPATPGLSLEDVIDAARRLRDQFRNTAAHHGRTGEFPFANFDALRDAGILNLSVDRRYGGLGMGIEAACRAVSTIAEGEPST